MIKLSLTGLVVSAILLVVMVVFSDTTWGLLLGIVGAMLCGSCLAINLLEELEKISKYKK